MTEVTNPVPEAISIGKQVPGTCIQLLDENGFLLPDGETGEIAIFGGQVTPGYVNDPARTAESFVTGPNGTVSAERYYRTGDLAYRTADGLIYFAGRADQQVKINGHRIELGEIDAALRSHPYVAEVATIARDGRLIAYFIPAGADDEIDVAALRAHLSAILPRFMLPAAILKIAKFPTTVNGKLDVTALPYEAMGLPAQETSSAVAFDDLTDRAVQIIGDVIGFTDQIRLSDNFIDDLGGTSLDILRVLVEFERRFGRRILINNALADTSVAGLTSLLRTQTASSSAAFAFNTDGESQPLFMIGSSLGGILGLRRVAELLPPNQPVYGLHVYPEGEQVNDKLTISTLAENAVKRIREVQPTGTIAVTGWSAGGLIAFESARILARLENSGTRVLLLDSPCPASVLDYYWGESVVYPKKVIPIALQKLRRAVVSQLPAKRRTGATTESRNLMEINEEQQEAAAAAVRRYRGEPYDGAITIMCTWQGRVMGWGRRQLGWGALPRGGVSIIGVPGSHLSLVEEPHVRTLVQKLCAWLAVD